MGALRFIRKYLATIVAGVIVACVIVGSFVAVGIARAAASGALVAVVHDSDGNVWELPLDEDATLEVETSLGRNVVIVEDGAAHVEEADCKNHDCMRQSPISEPGEQLICLPHKFWVEIVARGESGSEELDTDAVTWSEGEGPTSVPDDVDVDVVAR